MENPIPHAVQELQTDRTHGSRWLARRAVEALDALAPLLAGPGSREDLRHAARALAEARPAMAAIRNAVGWVYTEALAAARSDRDLPDAVHHHARQWLQRLDWAAGDIARHAERVVGGAVATLSYSHTVLHVLAARKDGITRVLVAESRPGYEGRATAADLAAAGIPVTLTTDAALPLLLDGGTVVVFGADAVLATGAVVNKAGTFPLAAAAVRSGARCYALTETFKVTDRPFIPEEADPDAVLAEPPPGVEVRSPLFDRTPPDLVEGYVTEAGILAPADLAPYVERARRYSEALGFLPGH